MLIFIMLLLQRKNWSSKSYTTSGCNIPQNINKTHTFQQIYNGEYSVVIGSYCLMDSNKNVDSHLVMIVLAGTVFFFAHTLLGCGILWFTSITPTLLRTQQILFAIQSTYDICGYFYTQWCAEGSTNIKNSSRNIKF